MKLCKIFFGKKLKSNTELEWMKEFNFLLMMGKFFILAKF